MCHIFCVLITIENKENSKLDPSAGIS